MDRVDTIRRFNRAVTLQIGALETRFLGRSRSLGASRVLFEIGLAGIEVRRLRERLELDSGYTSRLLRALEKEGLVRVLPSGQDARVRLASLTPAGKKELATLNRLSDEQAEAVLKPLSERQQAALASAMEEVERLLRAASVVLDLEDPATQDARFCLTQYYQELQRRFEHGFDPEQGISARPEELRPPEGYFVVARLHGEPVGCCALKCQADIGQIKRMWVASTCRGLGLGRRILGHMEDLARIHGLALLRLETNKSLVEAQALYRSSGYAEVAPFNDEPYAHHWFEKRLAAEARRPKRSRA